MQWSSSAIDLRRHRQLSPLICAVHTPSLPFRRLHSSHQSRSALESNSVIAGRESHCTPSVNDKCLASRKCLVGPSFILQGDGSWGFCQCPFTFRFSEHKPRHSPSKTTPTSSYSYLGGVAGGPLSMRNQEPVIGLGTFSSRLPKKSAVHELDDDIFFDTPGCVGETSCWFPLTEEHMLRHPLDVLDLENVGSRLDFERHCDL